MIETICPDLCQDYKIDITITRDAKGEKTKSTRHNYRKPKGYP